MARPIANDDGGEDDILPKPEESVPNQDALPLRVPTDDEPQELLDDGDDSQSILDDVDSIAGQLEQAGEAEEPPPALIDLPKGEPRPVDNPEPPAVEPPDLSEPADPIADELDSVDLAAEALDAPAADEAGGEAKAKPQLPDTLHDFFAGGGEMPPDVGGEDKGENPPEKAFLDANERFASRMTSMWLDAARRLDELTARIEADRL